MVLRQLLAPLLAEALDDALKNGHGILLPSSRHVEVAQGHERAPIFVVESNRSLEVTGRRAGVVELVAVDVGNRPK